MAQTEEKKTLVYGMWPNAYPYEYLENGHAQDIDIDIIHELLAGRQYQPEFGVLPSARLFNEVVAGRVQLVIMPIAEEINLTAKSYPEQVLIGSEPVWSKNSST